MWIFSFEIDWRVWKTMNNRISTSPYMELSNQGGNERSLKWILKGRQARDQGVQILHQWIQMLFYIS